MWPPLKLLWSRRAFEVGAPSALAEYLHLQQTGPGAQPASSALSCGCGDPGEGTTPEGPSELNGDSDDGDRAGPGLCQGALARGKTLPSIGYEMTLTPSRPGESDALHRTSSCQAAYSGQSL